MSLTRRTFIKTAAGSGAAAAAAVAMPPPAQARPNSSLPPKAVGLLFDSTLCVGCKACMPACKEANGMPPETYGGEALWDRPLDLSGKTLNVIKAYSDGDASVKDRETDGHAYVKKSCLHCVDPSCVSACPVSAMLKDPETGVVTYDEDACIGCRYCVAACPFGVPRFTYDRAFPVIAKCQLCNHRLKEGKLPACAEVCPTGATLFGPVEQLKVEAKRRLAMPPGAPAVFPRNAGGPHERPAAGYIQRLYGENELGGTQMLFLSGVPMDKLGYPDLPERSYASVSETIQHTLYSWMIAPVVVLGGLLVAAKRTAAHDDQE